MPQNANAATIAKNPSSAQVTLLTDSKGNLRVTTTPALDDVQHTFNITAGTNVKTTPGKVLKMSVIVAGAAGTLNDIAAFGSAAVGNQIAVIPAVVGVYDINWTCTTGIVVVPGAAQVVALEWI
jgi:hypothetical protein